MLKHSSDRAARQAKPGGEFAGPVPIGSQQWAERWRLEVQQIRHNIPQEPKRFAEFWTVGEKHRVWTLLNKADGSRFESFPEFCREKQPWGLNAAWGEVEQWLALVKGQKAARQETLPQPKPGPGRGKRSEKTDKEKKGQHGPSFPERTTKRLRAINRAPEPIRQLYEQDKLSQNWAAKLGPKNPSPEQAGRIAAVVIALKNVVDRKSADALVRHALGARQPSKVDKAFALLKTMTPAELRTLMSRVRKARALRAG
jgi:hypothetical protein